MLISIITVCFNAEKYIEKTILSVINQNYKNIEYIIIDGKSTDSTVEIIKKYESKISFWSSEPDNGIYDAMNKGVNIASGEIIYFLNSDDFLYNNLVISNILNIFQTNYTLDFVYGKINRFTASKSGLILDIDFNKNNLRKGKMPSHQAIFVKRNLFEKFGFFDLTYKSAADFEFICKIFVNKIKFEKADTIVANYSIEGYSNTDTTGIKECLQIIKKYFGRTNYFISVFRYIPIIIFRKIAKYFGIMKIYRRNIYPKLIRK